MSRKIEEIQADYSKICAQAGHINYQIKTLSNSLESLNQQLRALNDEAMQVNKDEKPSEEEKSNA